MSNTDTIFNEIISLKNDLFDGRFAHKMRFYVGIELATGLVHAAGRGVLRHMTVQKCSCEVKDLTFEITGDIYAKRGDFAPCVLMAELEKSVRADVKVFGDLLTLFESVSHLKDINADSELTFDETLEAVKDLLRFALLTNSMSLVERETFSLTSRAFFSLDAFLLDLLTNKFKAETSDYFFPSKQKKLECVVVKLSGVDNIRMFVRQAVVALPGHHDAEKFEDEFEKALKKFMLDAYLRASFAGIYQEGAFRRNPLILIPEMHLSRLRKLDLEVIDFSYPAFIPSDPDLLKLLIKLKAERSEENQPESRQLDSWMKSILQSMEALS